MQIVQSQVSGEFRFDDGNSLVQQLSQQLKPTEIKDPKIILVFHANPDAATQAQIPWKVRVFYRSPTPLTESDLNVDVVLMDTKIMPQGEEVIKTFYPTEKGQEAWIGWCGVINGQRIWIT